VLPFSFAGDRIDIVATATAEKRRTAKIVIDGVATSATSGAHVQGT